MLALVLLCIGADPVLPAEWHGAWKGECQIVGGSHEGKFPMELHFAPKDDGKFVFKIVYGEGEKKQTRNYELVPVKDKPGEFVNDEKNGIETDVRVVGPVMHSAFDVTGVLIHSRFELRDKKILVEMTSFDTKKPRETKLTGADMKVNSYRLLSVQRGELKRD
ncbi:MAG: hypothetical protein K1X57_00570 [Gemmataceae bacterium]|nr:hypothetical protein [Gemmataceae bacterium]